MKMNGKPTVTTMKRVRLELARERGHPDGSRNHGYDFIAPLGEDGRILAEDWKLVRDRCRVKRFAPGDQDEVGHIVRRPGGSWAFHYDIHGDPDHDEAGYKFADHKFIPGEYVSIKEHDGVLRTFKVMSVLDVD